MCICGRCGIVRMTCANCGHIWDNPLGYCPKCGYNTFKTLNGGVDVNNTSVSREVYNSSMEKFWEFKYSYQVSLP